MICDLEQAIHPNTLKYFSLPPKAELSRVRALDLLSPKRLDVIARLVFAEHLLKGWGLGWGQAVYREVLETACPEFIERDGSKEGFSDYVQAFSRLIESMRSEGFHDKNPIPCAQGCLVDGAHRLAAAIALNLDVTKVELEGTPFTYSAEDMRQMGVCEETIEALVARYTKLDPSVHIAFLFSMSKSLRSRAIKTLQKESEVVYQKELFLSLQGKGNLMKLLYGHDHWWFDDAIPDMVEQRFPSGSQLSLIFFKVPEGQHSRDVKTKVRKLLPVDHLIHSNDTHEESSWLADFLLSAAGVQYLNLRSLKTLPQFDHLMASYRKELEAKADPAAFCVDSGAVLAAFGLRDCTDLDYLAAERRLIGMETKDINCHNDEYARFPTAVDELVANPRYHFCYQGVKFLSLDSVYYFKYLRGDAKDQEDCRLIQRVKGLPENIVDGMSSWQRLMNRWRNYRYKEIKKWKRSIAKRKAKLFPSKTHRST